MKLLELYSLASGLKIRKQHLLQQFFPLPFTRYITIHASSGMVAKNYAYHQIIVDLLNPILAPLDIHIVQMGIKEDPELSGVYATKGKTNMHQGNHILANSMLHLGNDSVWCHRAGYLGVPLVELFGPTSVANHSPYQFDPSKTVFLESHRWGRRPTFSSHEQPMSIGVISPEKVVNSVLKLLGLPDRIDRRTQFIGQMFFFSIFDVIPNSAALPNLALEVPVTIRMDIEFNEPNLLAILQTGRKVTIVTKQCVNMQLLAAFRQNILSYNHEIDESCPIVYPAQVKSLIPNSVFFSRGKDQEALSKLRFHFFDHCTIEQVNYSTRSDYVRESALYLNISETESQKRLDSALSSGILMVKTNKIILSNGSAYRSYAHLSSAASSNLSEPPTSGLQVIDTEEFWQDLNHYHIYEEETKN